MTNTHGGATMPTKQNTEVFTVADGEWQVCINGNVLPAIWNSKGAAIAGLAVELRRAARKSHND